MSGSPEWCDMERGSPKARHRSSRQRGTGFVIGRLLGNERTAVLDRPAGYCRLRNKNLKRNRDDGVAVDVAGIDEDRSERIAMGNEAAERLPVAVEHVSATRG